MGVLLGRLKRVIGGDGGDGGDGLMGVCSSSEASNSQSSILYEIYKNTQLGRIYSILTSSDVI